VERVVAYIDGFNLYRGLKDDHQRKYLWLDLQTLAAFPPKRRSDELRKEVNHSFTIGEANLRASLLPNTVNGTLNRPTDWY
jgi:hypothetical protein